MAEEKRDKKESKNIMIAAAVIAVAAIGLVLILGTQPGKTTHKPGAPVTPGGSVTPGMPVTPGGPAVTSEGEVGVFRSQEDLNNFIKYYSVGSGYGGYDRYGMVFKSSIGGMPAPRMALTEEGVATEGGSSEYSTTNIQVEGVDEADIVKNDGKYIYVVSGKKIVIVDAYPAGGAKILSEIELKDDENPIEIFVNADRLVVFAQEYSEANKKIAAPYYYNYYSNSVTKIYIYDISDRKSPKLEDKIKVDGDYFDSRMIGDYVYTVVNEPIYYRPCYDYEFMSNWGCLRENIPVPEVTVDDVSLDKGFPEVYYWDLPDSSYRFTTIVAVNAKTGKASKKVFVMGNSQNMFVSADNIYITRSSYLSEQELMERVFNEVLLPELPKDVKRKVEAIDGSDNSKYEKSFQKLLVIKEYLANLDDDELDELWGEISKEVEKVRKEFEQMRESTSINKIAISEGKIEPAASGSVPGRVLNQFSMDEYKGNFRIATTAGQVWSGKSNNNVYVLDEDLEVIGKLEGLAKGETIYSARFMGDRCYLVTFKKTDPLFVIDLSDPEDPTVLGKLKIPGYSDYLHPYDETHLIGIGKGAVAAEEGDFAWYQGVKLSLFDVSNVEKPKEIDSYEIGDRGTDSEALRDHKAFLFSKSKNLLVIPVLLAKIDKEKYPKGVEPNTYGDYVWQGAYVFEVDLGGFRLKGKVSHADNEEFLKSGYYYYSPYAVKRSLYIENTLYTISDKKIKMNDLEVVGEEINEIDLPYEGYEYLYY